MFGDTVVGFRRALALSLAILMLCTSCTAATKSSPKASLKLKNAKGVKGKKKTKKAVVRQPKLDSEDYALAAARASCRKSDSPNSCVQSTLARRIRFRRVAYSSRFQVAYQNCQKLRGKPGEYTCIRKEVEASNARKLRVIP